MSGDYSKQSFKANKHYSDVLMQQGKVQLDSDWNEHAAIQFRRKRAQTIDTIGRAVVPRETENGFKITPDGSGDLFIHPGRMYVDGLLAENHGRLFDDMGTAFPRVFDASLDEERTAEAFPYANQPYLIFNMGEEALPATPFLAYLDVWQREVTHLKDPDIIETAVGIDTTTRMQTVWQVRTTAITSINDPECLDVLSEWDALVPSAGRLTTDTVGVNTEPDPCKIPPGGGYRGLENRLYRVEIHQGGQGGAAGSATFKWARHNGSVASAVSHIDGAELTVVQSQWDEFRRFEVGDWVEITDDKLEFDGLSGEMAKVDDVDYAANTITLTGVLTGNYPTIGPDKKTDPLRHTRIRKWDQSGVVRDTDGAVIIDLATTTDGLIPVPASTTTVVLEDGITVAFDLEPGSGEFKDADYWVFAARTEDASIELLDMAPPEGIHHHYARLAMVTTVTDAGIEDCRSFWPPESADLSCCSVTVGDGVHSHGDYMTIQEAVNSLPNPAGGKVCVLAGEYQESVVIYANSNIIIEGCGEQTKLIADVPATEFGDADPVFRVTDSTNIRIASLVIEAGMSGNGVLLEDLAIDSLRDIELHNLRIKAGSHSAIEVHFGSGIDIQQCQIEMQDVASDWPGIFLVADQAQIKENTIKVIASQAAATGSEIISFGRGGIQVGGTSDHVRVIDNLIQGGIGNGITLGSLTGVSAVGAAPGEQWVGWVNDPNSGVYEAMDTMRDILIEHNRIFDMGLNGIGVAGFFNLDTVDEMVSIEGLNIDGNEIRDCLNQSLALIEEDMVDSMGYGGISLADVEALSIQHNVIEDNGTQQSNEPVCGIFVLHAEGAQISDNRIINNGRRIQQESLPGPRGGIHIVYAISPLVGIRIWNTKLKFPRQSGVPAITVHNNVVVQPLGKALSLAALGPVSVTDNQFTSRGMVSNPDSLLSRISTISIINLGISDELYLQQLMTFVAISQGMDSYDPATAMQMAGQEGLDDRVLGRALASGNVLFNDNQCVCDLLGTSLNNFILSSVLIMSLDDISFHNNQCDCNLDLIGGYDLVLFPVFVFGLSVRMSDNRMKEGLLNAFLSAFSWGLFMHTATDNQATHCLIFRKAILPDRTFREHNIVFIDPTANDFCEGFKNLAGE